MKNTKEYATIKIVNLQSIDGVTKRTENEFDCEFYKRNESFYITYNDDADTGANKSRVFLKIQKDAVIMRRMGNFKSVMEFKEGKITDTQYRTPYGSISMQISTSRIINELLEEGGSLSIQYTLVMGNESIENDIHLEVKKEQKI